MKRLIILMIGLLIAGAVFVASLPFLVSTNTVRSRILEHISDLTGRDVSFLGDPKVSFSPFLQIEVSGLTITDADVLEGTPPLLSIETVKADMDVFSALVGQVKVSQYTLERPQLNLRTTSDGKSNWHFTKGRLKKAFEAKRAEIADETSSNPATADLGSFIIKDGTITYENRIDDQLESINNLNAELTWAETASPLTLNGTAVWRNENTKVDVSMSAPLALLAGGETLTSLSFASEPLNMTFDGKSNLLADLFVKGDVEASTPSITRLAAFLDLKLGSTGIIGEWKASGTLDASASATLLSDANIAIDGNPATGVVRLARNEVGKTKLDGTLAFSDVDLGAYFDPEKMVSTDTLNQPASRELDVDLRLSAQSVILGDVTLEKVAAAVTINDGDLKFDIGDAQAFGGKLVGGLTTNRKGEDSQVNLKVSANQADLQTILGLFGEQTIAISGNGDVKADLRSTGPFTSLSGLSVNGALEVTSANGTLVGLDFPAMIAQSTEETIEDNSVLNHEGNTDYETLSLKLFLNGSSASISKSELVFPSHRLKILGDINLEDASLDLFAQDTPTEASILPHRLRIGGTMSAPKISLKKALPPSEETESAEDEANKS